MNARVVPAQVRERLSAWGRGWSVDPTIDQFTRRALVGLIVLLGLSMAVWQRENVGDDALITLTYSKNLLEGNGFVFNAGEPTLGTTTPLLAMLVAAAGAVLPFLELTTITVLIGGVAWTGVAVVLYWQREAWGLTPWQSVGVALIVVSTIRVGLIGMEAALFSFLLIAALTLFMRERWLLAGLATGLLVLTRGEGALLGPILAVACVYETRSLREAFPRVVRLTAGAVAPIALWSAYALLAIGTVVPSTLDAKQAQLASAGWVSFADRLWGTWLPGFGGWFIFGPVHAWRILALIGLLATAVKAPKRLLLVAWALVYVEAYTALDVAGYAWYQETLLFVGNLFFAFGLVALVEWFRERGRLAGIAAVSLAGYAVASALVLPAIRTAQRFPGSAVKDSYLALAAWVNSEALPQERIASFEVGFLGYYTPNEIIDLAGLVSPEAIPHLAEGDYAWLFWEEQPDLLVYRPAFHAKLAGILDDPCFALSYRDVHHQSAPSRDNGDLIVYRRVQSVPRQCV